MFSLNSFGISQSNQRHCFALSKKIREDLPTVEK